MADFFSMVPQATRVEPLFDPGGIFSIPCGKYLDGRHGEKILNSCIGAANSIQGLGNTGKTAILMYLGLVVVGRYKGSKFMLYDAESSFQWLRLQEAISGIPGFEGVDIMNEPSDDLTVVKGNSIYGDELFDKIKAYAKERKPKEMKTSPFRNEMGELIKCYPSLNIFFDSFSATKLKVVVENFDDKHDTGSSKNNTADMKESNIKSKMINQMPNINLNGGVIFSMVSQLKKDIVMDQYAADTNNMAYTTRGVSRKGVSNAFGYINNNLWEIKVSKPLHNGDAEKTALYPDGDADRTKGTVDLQEIVMVQSRNKNGPAGFQFNLVYSQTEGFLPHLTCFYYIHKVKKGYGIGGNNVKYHLDLLPGVTVGRTTVRRECSINPKFQRAVEITAQLAQQEQLMKLDKKYACTPKELHDDLVAMGYDWDDLLDTRGHWVFVEDEELFKPSLTPFDLLRMRLGEYVPYWHKGKKKNGA